MKQAIEGFIAIFVLCVAISAGIQLTLGVPFVSSMVVLLALVLIMFGFFEILIRI